MPRMRVARLYAWGDVRVEDAPVPRPGPGEALVRIEACGVCGSDALGWYVERKAPVVLGHEPAGVVVETGAGVRTVAPGDRVFVHHHAPCLACEECRRGLWSNCAGWKSNGLEPGGFAEFACVRAATIERDTLRLPDELDFETATFIEPVACCIRALHRWGAVSQEDTVLIVGLGGMGLLLVQLARAFGAADVLGSDFLSPRRELARSLGAAHVFDATREIGDAVRDATRGRGADVIIICPGDGAAVHSGIEAAAPGARVVCFTPLPPDRSLQLDQSRLYFREISLFQSYSCGPDETRAAMELIAAGSLRTRPIITHRDGLAGVPAALERAQGKGAGLKTIIFPGH